MNQTVLAGRADIYPDDHLAHCLAKWPYLLGTPLWSQMHVLRSGQQGLLGPAAVFLLIDTGETSAVPKFPAQGDRGDGGRFRLGHLQVSVRTPEPDLSHVGRRIVLSSLARASMNSIARTKLFVAGSTR